MKRVTRSLPLVVLAATVLADLHDDAAALAHVRTAAQLAGETGHEEITAWTLETRAWVAVTSGRYKEAAALAVAAQEAAPRGTSALIQATAQEGRAWARLGDQPRTRSALARVEALASPLRPPACYDAPTKLVPVPACSDSSTSGPP